MDSASVLYQVLMNVADAPLYFLEKYVTQITPKSIRVLGFRKNDRYAKFALIESGK